MSKRTEETRELLGIVNANQIATKYAEATGKKMPPYIAYRTSGFMGRGMGSAAWQVHRPGFQTDPSPKEKRWWGNNDLMTFDVRSREEREAVLAEAKAWASERYGVTEWVKTNRLAVGATNTWFPAEVIGWLDAAINDAKNSPDGRTDS